MSIIPFTEKIKKKKWNQFPEADPKNCLFVPIDLRLCHTDIVDKLTDFYLILRKIRPFSEFI